MVIIESSSNPSTLNRKRWAFWWENGTFLLPRRIQTSSKQLFYGRNQFLGRIPWRCRRSKLLTKLRVLFQCLISTNISFGPTSLVFNSLCTQSTNPTTTIPLSHPRNISWRALFWKAATVTFCKLNFRGWRDWFCFLNHCRSHSVKKIRNVRTNWNWNTTGASLSGIQNFKSFLRVTELPFPLNHS